MTYQIYLNEEDNAMQATILPFMHPISQGEVKIIFHSEEGHDAYKIKRKDV